MKNLAWPLVLATFGCSSPVVTPAPQKEKASSETGDKQVKPEQPDIPKLRVRLYPYIPPFHDAQARRHDPLQRWLQIQWKKKHPEVDLDLEFTDTYDVDPKTLLGTDDRAVDIVEIDLKTFSYDTDLASLVGTWKLGENDFWPGAMTAAKYDPKTGKSLAWPTYLCGFVIYSTNTKLAKVKSAADLANFLSIAPEGSIPFVADMNGSSTLPPIYVDAFTDSHGYEKVPVNLDSEVIAGIRNLVRQCGNLSKEENSCLNDSADLYDNAIGPVESFGMGKAHAMFGYSEFIRYSLAAKGAKINPADLTVISAPLGEGSSPSLFVDGLVLNKNCEANAHCRERAKNFAEFLTSPEIQMGIAFASDTEESDPRYLLMARRSFWSANPVKSDPIYRQLRPMVEKGKPIGSTKFSKKELLEAILAP